MKKHRHHTGHEHKKTAMGSINQKYIIGGLGIVIVVLVVATFLISEGGNLFNRFLPTPTPTPPTPIPSGPPPTPTPIFGDTIMYDGYRFTPKSLDAQVGMVVNFANFGVDTIKIATNDTTEDGKKLNLGELAVGDTSQFVEFRKAGIYEYYNALNPEQKGRIVVRAREQ